MSPSRERTRKGSGRRFRRLEPYLLLLPALAVLAFFFFGPVLVNAYLSLQRISLFDLHLGGRFVGLENFRELLSTSSTWMVLVNTVVWLTFATVSIRLALGLGLALLVNVSALRRWRVAWLARTLLLIPWVTPPVVAVAAWKWLLQPRYGAVNQLLMEAGILDQGVAFLVRTDTVWWAIVIMLVWREVPFVAISYLAGLQSIPGELYEAGRIDGANAFARFRYITLPLLRPVTAVVTMLIIIWTFNNFVYVWLATRGGPGDFTQVLATQMYTEAFVNYRLGYGAAVGVLMSLIMVLFAIVYIRFFFLRQRRD